MKTIHIIVKYFYPVTAGIEVNIAETYSRLVKKGWKVILHTSRDTYFEKDILPISENIMGIEVRRYSFKNWGFFPKRNPFSFLACPSTRTEDFFPTSF